MHQTRDNQPFTYSFQCYSGEEPINRFKRMLSSLIARMELDVDTSHRQFHCEWRHIPLGNTDLNAFSTSGNQRVFHTPTPTQSYELLYLQQGPMVLEHDGQRIHVDEGQFILIDNHCEWTVNLPEYSDCRTMHIEREWISRWLAHPDRAVARPVERSHTWSLPFVSTMQSVYSLEPEQTRAQSDLMADTLGQLAALLFSDQAPPDKQLRYYENLYQLLCRFLHQHYDRQALNAEQVAEALKISRRQLHKICSGAGKSFANTLMDIRLEKARQMLATSQYDAYQICEVAWACGFASASHFSKRFRQRYQLSPEGYRRFNQPLEG